MKTSQDIKKDKGHGFKDRETALIYMIHCFECGRENWAMAVSSGMCAFCGYNPNEKEHKE